MLFCRTPLPYFLRSTVPFKACSKRGYSARPPDSDDDGDDPRPIRSASVTLPVTASPHSSHTPSPSFKPKRSTKVTIDTLRSLHSAGTPITMLTAHDYASARLLAMSASEAASSSDPRTSGIDICLCGDSLAMVSLGYESTTDITFTEFAFHVQAVRRGLDSVRQAPPGSAPDYAYKLPLLVADLPFGSFESSITHGVESAISLVRSARVDAVKIEGGSEIFPLVRALTSHGIAVMAHVGLTPQRHASLSGFKVQGKSTATALKILEDAQALQKAGAFSIVLEALPSRVASHITRTLSIPTIGIGAEPNCSGQVLVQTDMLGMLDGKKARFAEKWLEGFELGTKAIGSYAEGVKLGKYPVEGKHTYAMEDSVWEELVRKGWKA